MLINTLRAVARLDYQETIRSLVRYGYDSIGLGIILSIFIGGILVFLANVQVQKFGARSVLGWAAGYSLLREFGPLVIALAMTGRVGARNAAELASMKLGGQIEGLRGLGVDPYGLLVAPRWLASSIGIGLLGAFCIGLSVVSAAVFGQIVIDVESGAFFRSFAKLLTWRDLAASLIKMFAFGGAIALISTRCGLVAQGGARATGRAAALAVVASAACVSVFDWILTIGLNAVL